MDTKESRVLGWKSTCTNAFAATGELGISNFSVAEPWHLKAAPSQHREPEEGWKWALFSACSTRYSSCARPCGERPISTDLPMPGSCGRIKGWSGRGASSWRRSTAPRPSSPVHSLVFLYQSHSNCFSHLFYTVLKSRFVTPIFFWLRKIIFFLCDLELFLLPAEKENPLQESQT